MIAPWDPEFEHELLKAPDYRAFLGIFFARNRTWNSPRKISFQDAATRCGFKAKSFLPDVIAGRKRITPASAEKVIGGLRLSKKWAEYFRCLAGRDEPALQTQTKTAEYFRLRAERLQTKLFPQPRPILSNEVADIYLNRDFPDIWASLGTGSGSGTDFNEVVRRSRIHPSRVQEVLDQMLSSGLVRLGPKPGSYLPQVQALDLKKLGTKEIFRANFLRALDRAKLRLRNQSNRKDVLFMTQTFSVNSQTLVKYRSLLAEMISELADEIEEPNGDAVAEICISLTHNVSE